MHPSDSSCPRKPSWYIAVEPPSCNGLLSKSGSKEAPPSTMNAIKPNSALLDISLTYSLLQLNGNIQSMKNRKVATSQCVQPLNPACSSLRSFLACVAYRRMQSPPNNGFGEHFLRNVLVPLIDSIQLIVCEFGDLSWVVGVVVLADGVDG